MRLATAVALLFPSYLFSHSLAFALAGQSLVHRRPASNLKSRSSFPTNRLENDPPFWTLPQRTAPLYYSNTDPSLENNKQATNYESSELAHKLDKLLDTGDLGAAEKLLKSNPQVAANVVSLQNRDRWNKVFDAIERQTAEAEETTEQVNTRRMAEFPLTSKARDEMNNMYQTLRDLNQLQVFGAISSKLPPAAGSHAVRPSLLEDITGIPMKALTPKPSNGLLYAGAAVAILEGILSLALNINLNFLVLSTLAFAAADRLLLNGAIVESGYKLFSPGLQTKIERHEAGHFLCAYLLGCPVEGCVLNAWAALRDSRFGMGRQVTAGTSFFDPALSDQINSPARQVTRSSIDRYSIIVMAGIAAEAVYYGQADGGAGDEMALIAFLSQLNGPSPSEIPPWNNITIRNQARWGALQAVLILREYKACYEALVEALEKGGTLGDCIYAIEKAARDNGLGPLREPVGYIIEHPGDVEEWRTEKPDNLNFTPASAMEENLRTAPATNGSADPKESLAKLNEYRKEMELKLAEIDKKLDSI